MPSLMAFPVQTATFLFSRGDGCSMFCKIGHRNLNLIPHCRPHVAPQNSRRWRKRTGGFIAANSSCIWMFAGAGPSVMGGYPVGLKDLLLFPCAQWIFATYLTSTISMSCFPLLVSSLCRRARPPPPPNRRCRSELTVDVRLRK